MITPFAWMAERIVCDARALRVAATAALVASVLIVVTGGVVRLTGSGLGCPEWPSCTPGTLGPTAEMGVHAIVEFGNRLLTGILCGVVGWLIIVARLQANPSPGITRMAWAQLWIIVLNAMLGGITVWVRLNPYIVAAHFIAAFLLVTAAAVAWHLAWGLGQSRSHAGSVIAARLGSGLVASTALLIVAGTIVTGAGPHAGDSAVERLSLPWEFATAVHSGLAVLTLIIGGILWAVVAIDASHAIVKKRIGAFIFVVVAQGAIGVIQVVTHLVPLVVVLHLLGSTLVWIGALRVFLDCRLQATRDDHSRRDAPDLALREVRQV